jgi:hypothetical protein
MVNDAQHSAPGPAGQSSPSFKKIPLLNGHGGNNSFLSRRGYAVYVVRPTADVDADPQVKALRKTLETKQ